MTATPAQALTEIAVILVTNFTGYVELPNTEPQDTQANQVWARLRLEHTFMEQSTLANHNNVRRYTNDGIGTIELHFPLGEGVKSAYEQADVVASLYRGKRTPSDVWFRNVAIVEPRNIKGRHFRLDVVFDFTYDQIS